LIVLDTHALVWWVSGSTKLSPAAKRVIRREIAVAPVVVSTISIFEIVTAVRRGRLEFVIPAEQWLADVHALPEVAFEPVSSRIAEIAGQLDASFPGDPADRIIVATALVLDARLATANARLHGVAGISVVW
jgi:PIN domain nuclease of toxin-antitoxin system